MSISKYLPNLADLRNEMVVVLIGVAEGFNLLIKALGEADLTSLDGVQAAVLALAALVARAKVWSEGSVRRIRQGLE